MAKLTLELQELVLARVGKGASHPETVAWLKAEHGVDVTKQAIAKLVKKHRTERADVAKSIARSYIAKTLPKDLEAMDRVQARNLELLERAQEEAAQPLGLTTTNIEKVVKLTQIVQKADETKKRASGLDQPDEVINDLAAFLAKA